MAILTDPKFLNQIEYSYVFFAAAALLGAVIDYKTSKIPNFITVPLMLVGMAYGQYAHGMEGLTNSVLGIFMAFALFFPLFLFNIMGAGDGKMAMALASYLGWNLTIDFVLWAFLVGGLSSMLIVIVNGRYKPLVQQFYLFLKTLFTPNLAVQWPKLDASSRGPFGIALFLGFILTRCVS